MKFLVAYSGGMDSHVLLHKLASDPGYQVRAIHIHHNLSPNADSWAKHCQQVCKELNIECIVKYIDVLKSKHSLEATARKLRYQAIADELQTDEYLATAHHADDQAETLLLQLFRGAGPKGLAAMPKQKPFAKSFHVRPLLEISRTELYDYAKNHNLNWIEDESNENIGFDRNWLRHQVMPILKKRWPNIEHTLGRSARHCAEAADLLEDLAKQDCEPSSATLSITKLLKLSEARQNNAIRYWLKKQGFTLPTTVKLEHVKKDVLHSRQDANPIVHWPHVEMRKFKDRLYALSPLSPHDTKTIITWENDNDLSIRFRQGGETLGKKKLKNLLQEQEIPPWQRDRIPLLYQQDKLIGILTNEYIQK